MGIGMWVTILLLVLFFPVSLVKTFSTRYSNTEMSPADDRHFKNATNYIVIVFFFSIVVAECEVS